MDTNMNVTGNFVAYPVYTLALATNGQGGIGLSPTGMEFIVSNTLVKPPPPLQQAGHLPTERAVDQQPGQPGVVCREYQWYVDGHICRVANLRCTAGERDE